MRPRARNWGLLALPCGLILALHVSSACGQTEDGGPLDRRIFQRPHAVAQFDLGVLTLPGAHICLRPGICERAESSLLVSAWPLYRAEKHMAIGAGLTFGFAPSGGVPDAAATAKRSHSTNYFLAEATARYLPVVGRTFEAWLGLTSGLVVVNDGFKIDHSQPQQHYMGQTGSSLATEGLTLGATVGASWLLMPRLALGGTVRGGAWWMPKRRASTSLGDTASLSGNVPFLTVALSLSYSPG